MGYDVIIFAAISAISAGVGAYSSYQQGKAAKEQADYNAKTARINQQTTQQQADAEMQRVREKYRRVRGAQTAAAAASGLQSDGSLSDLFRDTNFQEDLDILNTMYKAKTMIVGEENKRQLSIMQGKQGYQAGMLGAAGSLLSGASSAYGDYPTVKAGYADAYPTISD